MKAGVVEHHHAAGGEFLKKHFFKVSLHNSRVAGSFKYKGCHQFGCARSGDHTGALALGSAEAVINSLASGCPAIFPIEPLINPAFIQVKELCAAGLQALDFALEKPAFKLVAFVIFYEFFLK